MKQALSRHIVGLLISLYAMDSFTRVSVNTKIFSNVNDNFMLHTFSPLLCISAHFCHLDMENNLINFCND